MKGRNKREQVEIWHGFRHKTDAELVNMEPVPCRGPNCKELTVDMRAICPKCREKMNEYNTARAERDGTRDLLFKWSEDFV